MSPQQLIDKMRDEKGITFKYVSEEDAKDSTTDGYDIVYQYLSTRPNTIATIEKSISSPHTANLINKYFMVQTSRNAQTGRIINQITGYDDCPVWVLMEVMTFGDIIHFYKDYYQSRNIPSEPIEALHLVRSLRNAAAHNNCLFADFRSRSTIAPQVLAKAVSQLGSVTNSQRCKKLSCRSVLEFVALLYEYDHLVLDKVREHRVEQLNDLFFGRMLEKKSFFINNVIAKYRSIDPRVTIHNWLRGRDVVEFLGLWEVLHNPDLNLSISISLKKMPGLTPEQISYKYADEADLLSVALFGKTVTE